MTPHPNARPTSPALTVVPSVPVWRDAGRWVLDRKFLDGLHHYRRRWPGPLRCLAWQAPGPPPAHGVTALAPAELPCAIELLAPGQRPGAQQLSGADVVLAAADDHRQLHLAGLCRALGQRCVYIIEYIPETRQQINRIETTNRLLRWRRQRFLDRTERQRETAFAHCHGLQANGLPAFRHYDHRQRLLYFDTRMDGATMPSSAALEQRLHGLRGGRPLHLAFSGRLIGMKGADHLLPLAARLRDRGLACRWTIFGAGELLPLLRHQRATLQLEADVTLAGAVDFATELVPRIQREVDLYVMPHRQSDPSCTYLETLACGIPIAGYLNRAFDGLLDLAEVGVGAALDDLEGLAAAIAALDADRPRLARLSRNALQFARGHSAEHGFDQRVAQLRQVAEEAP